MNAVSKMKTYFIGFSPLSPDERDKMYEKHGELNGCSTDIFSGYSAWEAINNALSYCIRVNGNHITHASFVEEEENEDYPILTEGEEFWNWGDGLGEKEEQRLRKL